MGDQLDRLVYPGFVAGLGADRLDDLLRWVRGVAWRADRLQDNLGRDAEAMASVRLLEAEHDELVDQLGWTPSLLEAAWQLQELRVSLFAQSVGARGPVSVKRVRAQLEEAAR